MSTPGRRARDGQWAGVAAALDAAVRELPSRLMHLDPRIDPAPVGSEVTRAGLELPGDWSAPARAQDAVRRACREAQLHPAVGAAASTVALRAVSSAVAVGTASVTVRAKAGAEGVYVSLRARSPGPPTSPGGRLDPARPPAAWGPGAWAGSGETGRDARGAARLFGVVVDAYGFLQDRSDAVVWFEVRRPVRPGTGPGGAGGAAEEHG